MKNKKNNLKKFLSFTCLAVIMLTSCMFSSCNENNGSENVNPYPPSNRVPEENVTYSFEPSFQDTDIVLVEKGETDFKILVPDEYDWRIQWAVADLTSYFKKSTGITLKTVSDGSVNADNGKYISLGRTQLSEKLNITFDKKEFGEDGHYIKTYGNSLIITGADDWSAYYGVLNFLRYNLGVKYYAWDYEFIADHTSDTVYLKNFDWKNIPDFAQRALGLANVRGEMADYRLGNESYFGRNWIGWAHTVFNLLPPTTYKKDHPDWYAASGNQLCYTNMEMRDELVKNIKKRIAESSYQNIYLEIGQMDGYGKCICAKCKAEEQAYGGWSGVQMRFINDINDRLQAWLKTEYPEKTLKLCVFAYFDSAIAPVIENADGSYSPIDSSVVAHENVGIMIAPLGADWAHSLWDEKHNKHWAKMMNSWKSIGADVYIWTYSAIFTNLLIFHDNYSYLKENYMKWKDMGGIYVYDQGTEFMEIAFCEMSAYVRSKLLWDVDANVEYYINEFVENYYGAGAPYILKYLDLVRTRMRLIERDYNDRGEIFKILANTLDQPELKSAEFWPREWLENAIALFDQAIDACSEIEDETQRDLMVKHIKKERLSPIYLLMEIYRAEISSKDCLYYADTFVEDCDLNGIVYLSEGREPVIKVTNEWYLTAAK